MNPSHPRILPRFREGMRIRVPMLCLFLSLAVLPVLFPTTGFAAITAADLTEDGSATTASSYTTASVTPSSNNLVLAWVTNSKGSTPDTPTLSGNGLTWVQVATVTWGTSGTPTKRTTLFRAMGSAPTSGAVTIAFGGVNQTGCLWSIQQFDGVVTSGTNGSGAVVQSVTGRANSAGTGGLSITLAALSSSLNATAGGFSNRINSSTSLSAGAGYTAFPGAAVGIPAGIRAEWDATGTTTVNMTQSATSDIAGIAVEIGALPPADSSDLVLTLSDNPDPVAPGGYLLYKVLIVNNGPAMATNVVATNVLPASVTLVSAAPSQGSCSGTATVTCNLGVILDSGTASVDILVVTSTTGTITDSASVTLSESDPVPGNNAASVTTQVVAGSSTGMPLTQYRRIHNFVDYTVTGGTLRTQPNPNPGACAVGASSTAALSGIPGGATVVGAYLYWAGSGSTVDSQVTLNGTAVTADRTFTARYVLSPSNFDFFGGFKDVTAQVQATRNGNYTFGNLTVTTADPYCASQAVLAGWSLIVIYQDTSLTGKTLVLYDGFDLKRNGATAYNLTGIFASTPTEGKATYLLWEGDPDAMGGTPAESLTFNGSTLSDALNPADNPYNSTINSLGVSTSYGVDLDTFNVSSYVNGGDTLATTSVSTGNDLVILNAVIFQVKSNVITGRIFEDVNYGGGAGRNYATAVASAPGFTVPRPGAVVELYDAGGSFLFSTTTDASGLYGFSGLPDGDFTVRVVNSTVTSSRTGATGNERAVQTYRTDAGTGTAVAVTNEVGGTNPAGQDAPAGKKNDNLGSFLAQSKAPAKVITGLAVTGVDFGFNFDTIVNTNDTGQGSLRQFLANANAMSNTGLAQAGRTAGIESAIFMISNGTSAPGLRASLNYFSGGVATLSPASPLPTVTDLVILDARTQPGWASVPIIEINGTGAGGGANGLTLSAGNSTVRGLVINRFSLSGILLTTNGSNTIEGNYIGTNAAGTAPAANGQQGISINGTSGNRIGGTTAGAGNLLSGNGTVGVGVSGAGTGNAILGNSIYGNTGIGIDLGLNGVTANDGAKTAGQPNLYMDFPVFTSTFLNGSTLTVTGYVGSAPNQATFAAARVEVFKSDNDPSGYGEGRTYLGFLTTDASGTFSGALAVSGVAAGDRITGTATDGSNNTSEFGANVTVTAPGYQPDAMIKLASEGAGAYATDNVYETTAATQVKSQGVVSASTAIYNVLFQNDGTVSDNVVITQAAADNCAGFTVQYLDNTSTDRSAAVTGAGYTISGMAVGAGTTWTLRVTPAGTVAGGSPACRVSVTATSAGNGAKVDQVRAITSSISANLTLLKNADRATVATGQDITYTVNASNGAGFSNASAIVVADPIPAFTGFKVGSATFSPGTSTLSGTPSFSSDNGASWSYPPVSGGCAAPAGYDYCVTNVRWTTSGIMPAGTSFTVNFVVRVR